MVIFGSLRKLSQKEGKIFIRALGVFSDLVIINLGRRFFFCHALNEACWSLVTPESGSWYVQLHLAHREGSICYRIDMGVWGMEEVGMFSSSLLNMGTFIRVQVEVRI